VFYACIFLGASARSYRSEHVSGRWFGCKLSILNGNTFQNGIRNALPFRLVTQ